MPDDLADILLGAQFPERVRQSFGFLAQSERDRQHFLGRDALAVQVVTQPGVPAQGPPGQRLARTGQVVELAALLRLVNLPVDPRGEADLLGFTFCHPSPF
jgi:hypothetical protein